MNDLTLDPPDWNRFRRLAHRALDDTLDFQQNLRDTPVWQPLPAEVRERLREPVPHAAQGEEAAYESFARDVLPFSNGNRHARFFGWVQGNGLPLGMLADMLASGMNPHMAGFDQSAREVELQVLEWLRQLMGMPEGTTGLLCSGGSMANLLGLAVGRQVQAGFDLREQGLQGGHPPLVVYMSAETHGWAGRSVDVLGLGRRYLRIVPVDGGHRLDPAGLREQIAADRQADLRPALVIGTAGTVNIGATDDLVELRSICDEHELWLHVDGAFGALARLSPRLAPRVAGLELADSLAFDLHKWMYLPFEIACVLVRDGQAHHDTFSMTASYLTPSERGVSAGGLVFNDRGIELSRGFKALKAWMCLKAYGVDAFAALIEQNVEQAATLAELVRREPTLELAAPVPLNVVCLRHRGDDALNQELMLRLQESGIAVLSSTRLEGRLALRCCITNHRTRREDLDLLVATLVRLGAEIESQGRA